MALFAESAMTFALTRSLLRGCFDRNVEAHEVWLLSAEPKQVHGMPVNPECQYLALPGFNWIHIAFQK